MSVFFSSDERLKISCLDFRDRCLLLDYFFCRLCGEDVVDSAVLLLSIDEEEGSSSTYGAVSSSWWFGSTLGSSSTRFCSSAIAAFWTWSASTKRSTSTSFLPVAEILRLLHNSCSVYFGSQTIAEFCPGAASTTYTKDNIMINFILDLYLSLQQTSDNKGITVIRDDHYFFAVYSRGIIHCKIFWALNSSGSWVSVKT